MRLGSQCQVSLSKYDFGDKMHNEIDIQFPCKLAVEETATLHMSLPLFIGTIEKYIDEKKCFLTDKISMVVFDSTEKEYKLNTDITIDFYVKYYEKIMLEVLVKIP